MIEWRMSCFHKFTLYYMSTMKTMERISHSSRLSVHLFKESLDQHLGGHIQQPLPHRRNRAAHLHIAVITYIGSGAQRRKRKQSLALEEPDFAGSFHDQPVAVRRISI